VVSGAWSSEVTRLAVWLAGQVSYEQASHILSQVGQIDISGSSIWRRVQEWGDRLLEHEQQACAQANAVPERDVPQRGEVRHDQPMGVSVDGWMVHVRGEGWKEVKTGAVFCVEQQEVTDRQTGEPVERAVAQDCTYIAHLGGPEDFGAKLWTEASRRKVPGAYEKAWVSDGAAWIWGLCQDYFPEAEQIVDWYHALAHLHSAANLLHGEGTDKAKRWAESMKTTLFQGRAARIADSLDKLANSFSGDRADKLKQEVTFFRNNHRRMRYLEYREDGWPIGSGTIESGCKQFQTRMKGPGMRWSRPGAERMLALRSVILSLRFDQIWASLQNPPVF
jgi:hypothetical protein